MMFPTDGFVGEGNLCDPEDWNVPSAPPEEKCWYRELFYANDHKNFFAKDSPLGMLAISVRGTDEVYYLIVRTEHGVETFTLAAKDVVVKKSFLRLLSKRKSTEQYAITTVKPELSNTRLYERDSSSVRRTLLELETPDVFNDKYRVGLLFSALGQMSENELFCNTEVNHDFLEFMELLGDQIQLKGWGGYEGGLDVVGEKSGATSLFTRNDDREIMWHVPILMPYFHGDEQQLERKKHVGNDRAVVIFQEEGGDPFPADIIASKAIHLCIAVQPFRKEGDNHVFYRMGVAYKQSVPFFEPHIPPMAEYRKGVTFRDLFLNKLINGIQATSHADEFKALMGFKYKHALTTLCTEYGVKASKREKAEDAS